MVALELFDENWPSLTSRYFWHQSWFMVILFQWRAHGRDFGDQNPPIDDWKRNENPFFKRFAFFSLGDCRNCYDVFLCYPTCLILKIFYCDAIIPEAKLFWCVALDVDDCRKNKTFLFWNKPTFLRSLPKLLSCFFCSVQLSNLISAFLSNFLIQFRETFITMRCNNTGIPTFLKWCGWTAFLSLMLLWSNR